MLGKRLTGALLSVAAATLLALATPAQADEKPITIGFGMALTGGLAPNGKAALLAMQIWQDNVNAHGGLLGRPVKLVYYDNQSNPANVPGIYVKLLEIDKVDLVVTSSAQICIARTPDLPTAARPPVSASAKPMVMGGAAARAADAAANGMRGRAARRAASPRRLSGRMVVSPGAWHDAGFSTTLERIVPAGNCLAVVQRWWRSHILVTRKPRGRVLGYKAAGQESRRRWQDAFATPVAR